MNWLFGISVVLSGLLSLSGYIKTGKLYKLVYVIIWAWFFIGIPLLGKITSNSTLQDICMVLGLIPISIFLYWDVKNTIIEPWEF